VLVRGVDAAGPAGRGGVLVGDLIVRLGDNAVTSIDDLQDALDGLTADTVEIALVRGVEELTVTISFVET
jgi:S1-C subfamily serine protease